MTKSKIINHKKLPIINISNVDVDINNNKVLRSLNWQLGSNDHWAIIGSNGSGKTSFLKLISGALWPKPGSGTRSYNFDGKAHTDAVEALKRISVVSHELQDSYANLGWDFKAIDIVISGIKKTNIPRLESSPADNIRARSYLKKLGLTKLNEKPFLELSRGQQRRILIARALAFNPKVLILDEPVAGLDKESRQSLRNIIELISSTTITICSYHNDKDLPNNTNNLLYLSNGKISKNKAITKIEKTHHKDIINQSSFEGEQTSNKDKEVIIDIHDASIWINKNRILSKINWKIYKNQHWQIIGPNGSGKSTLLRLLHGQIRPAKGGYIKYLGIKDAKNVWSLRRQVAWVSPELQSNYNYKTNVFDCIGSGFDSSIGLIRKLTSDELKTVQNLIEKFNLDSLKKRDIKNLSYGQFRRVLIARSIVHMPKLLLLDEPWEGLDTENQYLINNIIQEIVKSGTQLICATHIDSGNKNFKFTIKLNHGKLIS